MASETGYIAVRKSNETGNEWLDLSTLSLDAFLSDTYYKNGTKQAPTFAAAHPLVRIAHVKITEIDY